MAKIISGKEVSAKVRAEVKVQCDELKAKEITPGLAVIIVGDDPASRVYVNNKKKACAEVGFVSEEYALPTETTQEELLALVEELNNKPEINGILCQLPLPKHLAVHGWITFNGTKMSKSLGNVVDPFILGERYGADAIRYHILREMALGADSDFSNEILINRINSDCRKNGRVRP